jgi:hypothetical protein
MHTHRAAVHDAADPGCGAELDELFGSVDVHLTVLRVRDAGTPKYRGQVIHSVDSLRGLTNYIQVPNVTGHGRYPGAFQRSRLIAAPNQTPYPMSGRGEAQGQRHTGEACGAGDENLLQCAIAHRNSGKLGAFLSIGTRLAPDEAS